MKRIPEPIPKETPEAFRDFYDGQTGTLVILTKCDRVSENATELNAVLANYLGRTYRKFIGGGVCIKLNGNTVYLHDPHYISWPTQFDFKEGGPAPKATLHDEARITFDIPNSGGQKADITIRLSLLPYEWRKNRGDGGSTENKKRKIDQNEGFSILRANREVLYGQIPYLIGPKGQAKSQEKDRFWGCEISFPPELDDYFQVRYIKRGAEPVGMLKDRLRQLITPAIVELRKSISAAWDKNELQANRDKGIFGNVEHAVESASAIMPASKKGLDLTEPEENALAEKIVNNMCPSSTNETDKQKERAERKKHIKEKFPVLVSHDRRRQHSLQPMHPLPTKRVLDVVLIVTLRDFPKNSPPDFSGGKLLFLCFNQPLCFR